MTKDTEQQLNDLVKTLTRSLAKVSREKREIREELDNLNKTLEDGRETWSRHQPWNENGLPVPRLELHWKKDGEYDSRCWYLLVYKHLLHTEEKPDIVAVPLGLTRSGGGSRNQQGFMFGEYVDTPFRDGAHAAHDSTQLKIPLYVTNEDGAVDFIDVSDGYQNRRSTIVRRPGK